MVHNQADKFNLPACPQARQPETDNSIIALEVIDEFVIYDMNNDQAHNLNSTATSVWQWCDGHTNCDTMVSRLADKHSLSYEQAEEILWLTFDQLERAGLLQSKLKRPFHPESPTRRAVLANIGIAALLPVIQTIIAPPPSQAQSGGTPTTVTYYSGTGCSGSSFIFNISDLGGAPLSICYTPDASTNDPCGEGQNVLSYQTNTGSCTSC